MDDASYGDSFVKCVFGHLGAHVGDYYRGVLLSSLVELVDDGWFANPARSEWHSEVIEPLDVGLKAVHAFGGFG